MTGDDLRAWRSEAGLTQAQAAASVGITTLHWSRLECGRARITRTFALALAAVRAGLSPEDAEH